MKKKRIGIIGAGVVGTAVGVMLHAQGYEITGVYDIELESTQSLVRRTECKVCQTPQEVTRFADVVFITTCDSVIGQVVDNLADLKAFKAGQVLVHMSGAQSSQIMARASEYGVKLLSVHPLQSFASTEMAVRNLRGSVFSIEGDREAYNIAVCIVEALGGEYFFIDQQAKPLYHAGACVVSNYLVSLVDLGVKLLEETGIPSELAGKALIPLIQGTINNIEKIGIPYALTGPIARGDLSTVKQHLDCMHRSTPELIALYSALGYYTAPISFEKGGINESKMEAFQEVFAREMASVGSISKGGKEYAHISN